MPALWIPAWVALWVVVDLPVLVLPLLEVWAVLFLSGQRFPVGVRTRLFSFQVRLAVAALPCCGQPDREPLLFGCHFPIRLPGSLRHGYPFVILCFGTVNLRFLFCLSRF